MASQNIFNYFIFLTVILTISMQQVFSLNCWSCSNLLEFCDDPFDPKKVSEGEQLSLIDCTDGMCIKSVANIKGRTQNIRTVNRFCAWNQQVAEEYCKDPTFTSCVACTTDECNGAAQNEKDV